MNGWHGLTLALPVTGKDGHGTEWFHISPAGSGCVQCWLIGFGGEAWTPNRAGGALHGQEKAKGRLPEEAS
jgi:hypothetical protein